MMSDTKPEAQKCVCGKMVEPMWIAPIMKNGILMPFTGKWAKLGNQCDECYEKEVAADDKRREQELKAEQMARAGLQDAYIQSLSFKAFTQDTGGRKGIAAKVKPLYTEAKKTGVVKNLFLSGPAGTGKTMLGVSFVKMAMAVKRSVYFCSVPEMVIKLRSETFRNRQREEIDRLVNHDVPCLDDLGAEKTTDWVNEAIYLIIDKWYRQMRGGLIITTNLTLGQVSERFGDRLASRMAGMCEVIDFSECPDGRIHGR